MDAYRKLTFEEGELDPRAKSADEKDNLVYIPKLNIFKQTFSLLRKAGCEIISASMRQTYPRSENITPEITAPEQIRDAYHQDDLVRVLYSSLDASFGKERDYLKKDVAEEYGRALRLTFKDIQTKDKSQMHKVRFIKHHQRSFPEGSANYVLVDDCNDFREEVEKAGGVFILATPDLAHLAHLVYHCVDPVVLQSFLSEDVPDRREYTIFLDKFKPKELSSYIHGRFFSPIQDVSYVASSTEVVKRIF